MPTVPVSTPTPKKTPSFSAVERYGASDTYQTRPKRVTTCTGAQKRVSSLYQKRSSSGVSGSAFSRLSPAKPSAIEKTYQVHTGSSNTAHPPQYALSQASGTSR